MQVGKWLDMRGWVAGGSRTKPVLREKRPRATNSAYQYDSDMLQPAHSGAVPHTYSLGHAHTHAPPAAKIPKTDPDEPLPWERMHHGGFAPVRVKWSGDRCAVCSSEVDYDTDQLIHCHSCGIAVHQSCYGVRPLPQQEDKWVCRACEHVHGGGRQPQCVACPVEGGALKPTTIRGMWCHLACMQVRATNSGGSATAVPFGGGDLHCRLCGCSARWVHAVCGRRCMLADAIAQQLVLWCLLTGTLPCLHRPARCCAYKCSPNTANIQGLCCACSGYQSWASPTRSAWSQSRALKTSVQIVGRSTAPSASRKSAPRCSAASATQRSTHAAAE